MNEPKPDFRPGLVALLDQAMIRPATPEEGDAAKVELIRAVLSRGSYQMPLDPLPYSTQAHAVWEAIRGPLTAERDRATWTEANRWSAALGFGDNITEPAGTVDDAKAYLKEITDEADEHQECPVWCDACDWWERKASCESCHGSGTTMPTHSDCGACGGDGTDHIEYSLTGTPITELRAENERLRKALEDAHRVLRRPDRPRTEQFLDDLTHGGREEARDVGRVDRAAEIISAALAGGEH